jgi:hypothetical protein
MPYPRVALRRRAKSPRRTREWPCWGERNTRLGTECVCRDGCFARHDGSTRGQVGGDGGREGHPGELPGDGMRLDFGDALHELLATLLTGFLARPAE